MVGWVFEDEVPLCLLKMLTMNPCQLCQFHHNVNKRLFDRQAKRVHLHMASHELGDLLWKAETFQKLLSHSFVAGGAQHLGCGIKE